MKNYYFPNDDIDNFFGSSYPVCISMKTIKELAHGWEMSAYALQKMMHKATAAEIEKYGVEE